MATLDVTYDTVRQRWDFTIVLFGLYDGFYITNVALKDTDMAMRLIGNKMEQYLVIAEAGEWPANEQAYLDLKAQEEETDEST